MVIPPRPMPPNDVSLVLYCRDEGPYLPEWLDYHFALGVDHVYLVDNASDDPLSSYVESYLADGRVTLILDPGPMRQVQAYHDILARYGKRNRWLGFIDTDEFIVLKQARTLPEFLSGYEAFGGVGLFWACFGSSGWTEKPASVIESYTWRSEDSYPANAHVKSFVQPRHTRGPGGSPHLFEFLPGYSCVNENGVPLPGPISPRQRSVAQAQINHYITRTEAECLVKIARGGPQNAHKRPPDYFQRFDVDCNRIEDRSAQETLARAAAWMGKIDRAGQGNE